MFCRSPSVVPANASGTHGTSRATDLCVSLVAHSASYFTGAAFFFQITGAFAELERHLIRERTLAGLASARQRGRKGGRQKAIDPKTFAMALHLYEARTSSVQSICTHLGIALRTFYRELAAHR